MNKEELKLKKEFFCPMINGPCKGAECIAMEKKTYRWTNEGCQGAISYHSYDYLQCRHYEEAVIFLPRVGG